MITVTASVSLLNSQNCKPPGIYGLTVSSDLISTRMHELVTLNLLQLHFRFQGYVIALRLPRCTGTVISQFHHDSLVSLFSPSFSPSCMTFHLIIHHLIFHFTGTSSRDFQLLPCRAALVPLSSQLLLKLQQFDWNFAYYQHRANAVSVAIPILDASTTTYNSPDISNPAHATSHCLP